MSLCPCASGTWASCAADATYWTPKRALTFQMKLYSSAGNSMLPLESVCFLYPDEHDFFLLFQKSLIHTWCFSLLWQGKTFCLKTYRNSTKIVCEVCIRWFLFFSLLSLHQYLFELQSIFGWAYFLVDEKSLCDV